MSVSEEILSNVGSVERPKPLVFEESLTQRNLPVFKSNVPIELDFLCHADLDDTIQRQKVITELETLRTSDPKIFNLILKTYSSDDLFKMIETIMESPELGSSFIRLSKALNKTIVNLKNELQYSTSTSIQNVVHKELEKYLATRTSQTPKISKKLSPI